jgi:hypothetical protein
MEILKRYKKEVSFTDGKLQKLRETLEISTMGVGEGKHLLSNLMVMVIV